MRIKTLAEKERHFDTNKTCELLINWFRFMQKNAALSPNSTIRVQFYIP